MKRVVMLAAAVMILAACNLPAGLAGSTSTPAEPTVRVLEDTPSPPPIVESTATSAPSIVPGTEYNLGSVVMVVPPCLPVTATGVIVPAQVYDPLGGPMEVYPQQWRINFSGYPLSGTFFEPVIRIYPVDEFAAAYAGAAENYAAQEVDALQTLVATQPPDSDEALPFLTMAGAAQIFHAQAAYLDFGNGSGVRYLTSYGQYYVPYNNHDLFYTFQGLTDDGRYWVSVILPVNHALLPPTYDSTFVPAGGIANPLYTSPTFETEMSAYYSAMKALMNAQTDNSFTPMLDCLDQLVMSISVGE